MKAKFDKYRLTREQSEILSQLQALIRKAGDTGIEFYTLPESGAVIAFNNTSKTLYIDSWSDFKDKAVPYALCSEVLMFSNLLPTDCTVCGIPEQ